MATMLTGLLILALVCAVPQVHHSVPQALQTKSTSLLVTFRSADFHAAEDPEALLRESRKHLPFLLAVDAETFAHREELYHRYRGQYVLSAVNAQHEIDRRTLEETGATILQSFAVSNSFVIEADEEVVNALARLDQVVEIHTNAKFEVEANPLPAADDLPEILRLWQEHTEDEASSWDPLRDASDASSHLKDPQWNIKAIGAQALWRRGFRGQGMTYAVADTGLDYLHPNVAMQYRGRNPDGSYNHNHNWWDGVRQPVVGDSSPSRCPVASSFPCDDQGHGTHVASIAVGAKGYGVAPKARLIACRNMDNGVGSSATYLSCLNFFLAPHDLQGNNPRDDLRPHAVGNSYGCPDSEGCSKHAMTAAFNALRAAGVFMAVSAGNDGPRCSTVDAPPAIERSALVVGAVARNNLLASFSSRGPVSVVSGVPYRKPDVVAPGVGILAAYPNKSYRSLSGTSMAGPHAGGGALLLMQACPCLNRNPDALKDVFQDSAIPLLPLSNQLCGVDTPKSVPNNHFGFGAINLEAAARLCEKACS